MNAKALPALVAASVSVQKTLGSGAPEFRAELLKIMPGYAWTVHKSRVDGYLQATGMQSSGSNRLSTLEVTRIENDKGVRYTARSAGYGLRARWLHTHTDGTLARALRRLQDHYEAVTANYRSHGNALKEGRAKATGSAS